MPKVKISKDTHPDLEPCEIEIYPDGDKTRPRIGVLKIEKGRSNFILDEGLLPYQNF